MRQHALRDVNWVDTLITLIKVALTKDQVRNSREYDPTLPDRDDYAQRLEPHYRIR